jgi:hypothetical protein
VIIGVVFGLLFTHGFAFHAGQSVEEGKAASVALVREAMAGVVKDSIADMGHQLGADVLTGFKQIQVTNQTVVRNIYNEKEVHRVLSDPNCAWPVSTVRVRNESRLDPDPAFRAGQRPDAGVRKPAAAPGGEAAPAR